MLTGSLSLLALPRHCLEAFVVMVGRISQVCRCCPEVILYGRVSCCEEVHFYFEKGPDWSHFEGLLTTVVLNELLQVFLLQRWTDHVGDKRGGVKWRIILQWCNTEMPVLKLSNNQLVSQHKLISSFFDSLLIFFFCVHFHLNLKTILGSIFWNWGISCSSLVDLHHC